MNKKVKILIGILVIVILVAGGWWVWTQWFYSRPECFEYPDHCFRPFAKYDNRIAKLSICQFDEDCNLTDLAFRCVNKNNSIEAENLEKLLIKDCPEVTPADKSIFRCECKNNICTQIQERIPEEPQEKVTIAADKTEYEQGEIVRITIQNKGNEAVDFCGSGVCSMVGAFPTLIEKYENNKWVQKFITCPIITQKIYEVHEVIRKEIYSCVWLPAESSLEIEMVVQRIDINGEGGLFRTVYYYGEDRVSIYSNEFTIKEKEEASALKDCNLYEMPMIEEQIKECTCPEGYKKFNRLMGAYCATDSQKPCSTHADCPEGERCISSDRKNWFCTGQFAGCYYRNPENPEEPMLCAD